MKTTLFYFAFGLLITLGQAQSINREIEINAASHLAGKFTHEKITSQPYAEWFTKNHDNYSLQQSVIEQLSTPLSKCTLTLFMGTWCGDSKEEVPRLYRVLEASDFPLDRLTSVALQLEKPYYKQSPGGEEEGLNIHRVPTIIVYKEGKELGRIVEHPRVSIEADLLQIMKGDYKENYYSVSIVSNELKKLGSHAFGKRRKKIARLLKDEVEHYMELHSYSRLLRSKNKNDESLEVLKLNQLLFPKEPHVYFNLGVHYWEAQKFVEAQKQFDLALAAAPKNDEMKGKIKFITENRNP